MRRLLLLLALSVGLAPAVRADDSLEKTVADLAAQLGVEDVEKREAALTALVRLGMRAEAVVRAEMNRATDPEVRGRLLAALQMYSLEEEETWTIAQLRKGEPFPPSKAGYDKITLNSPDPIPDIVDRLREESGVKIELYAGDPGLADLLARRSYPEGRMSSMSGPGALENALWELVCLADLAMVVDGDRVVIVRLTPAVLFERLGSEMDRGTHYWMSMQLVDFEAGPFQYWVSAQRFLQLKALAGGPPRELWFELLKNRALDRAETDRNRSMALLGLKTFLGSAEDPQQDVDDVMARLVRDPQSPAAVRRSAARGLAWGMTETAQELALDILDGQDEALQIDMLLGLLEASNGAWSAVGKFDENPVRLARLQKSTATLSASKSPALSLHANVFRAWRREPEAQADLPKAPEPADPLVRLYYMHALHLANTAAARERLLEFSAHADPKVRAGVAAILGGYSGGKDREPDTGALLEFLKDPAPIVRHFAAKGLGTIFSTRAAVRFDSGKEAALERLKAVLGTEKDARVKETIESAIKDAGL